MNVHDRIQRTVQVSEKEPSSSTFIPKGRLSIAALQISFSRSFHTESLKCSTVTLQVQLRFSLIVLEKHWRALESTKI